MRPRCAKPKLAVLLASLLFASGADAGVTAVEAGHELRQLVDSFAPLDPSQSLLETACAFGNAGRIESIGVDPTIGTLFVQLLVRSTTCIFAIDRDGVVTTINPDTEFHATGDGTDLQFDPTTGLLVTVDAMSTGELPPPPPQRGLGADGRGVGDDPRLATIDPTTGDTGTYAPLPVRTNGSSTLGIDFSTGAGGTDVPAGDAIFSFEHRVWSSSPDGPVTSHRDIAPIPGTPFSEGIQSSDLVVQPDGDWIWLPMVGQLVLADASIQPPFRFPMRAVSPVPQHDFVEGPLDLATLFATAGLPFDTGPRATICDKTGDLYVSYSGGSVGGTGIFRVDEDLQAATLVVEIDELEGLQDLRVGPATTSKGSSVFFTVHDNATGGEEVWELTLPECAPPTIPIDIDVEPHRRVNRINVLGRGLIPIAILGSETFEVADVDVASLTFGPGEAAPVNKGFGRGRARGRASNLRDVNRDRIVDLVTRYRTHQVGIAFGDSEVCLRGALLDGTPIQGCDAIRTLPACGIGFELALLLPPLLWVCSRRRSLIH